MLAVREALKQWALAVARRQSLAGKLRNLAAWASHIEVERREIPSGWRALVVAPHQDDEAIGAGGTTKLVTERGGHADVVFCTNGERGFALGATPSEEDRRALVRRRREEAQMACAELGVRDTFFFDAPDGRLYDRQDLSDQLARLLDERGYDVLLAPWPYDQHVDHRAAYAITRRALRRHDGDVETWFYEVWTPLLPNIAVDISSVSDAKQRAIVCHESQVAVASYAETAMALGRYRSMLAPGAEHVEAFLGGDKRFALSLP